MTVGRRGYGLAAMTLGIPGLVYGSFAMLGQPVPTRLPAYQLLAWAASGLLVLAGLAANLPRVAAAGSLALAGAAWIFADSLAKQEARRRARADAFG